MRRALTPLIVLLVLQLALAGGLLLRRNPLAAVKTDTPLLAADVVHKSDRIVIESHAAAPAVPASSTAGSAAAATSTRIVLQKKADAWVLPDTFDVPADSVKVNSLLDRLVALRRGLPIATSESALRRFKVTDSDFERRLVLAAGGKTLDTVYFGASPGLRKSDARSAEDKAVYAVDLPTYELPTDVAAWLSPDLIRVDTAGLAQVGVSDGHTGLQLVRNKASAGQPESWSDPELKGEEHIDSPHAIALVQQIAELRADAVLGTAALPAWQQDHPALVLTFKDDKGQTSQWTLSKPTEGDYYVLKTSGHPWYFSISSTTGKALLDAAARSALIASPARTAAGKAESARAGSGKTNSATEGSGKAGSGKAGSLTKTGPAQAKP